VPIAHKAAERERREPTKIIFSSASRAATTAFLADALNNGITAQVKMKPSAGFANTFYQATFTLNTSATKPAADQPHSPVKTRKLFDGHQDKLVV
jgi:hypothetical protein